MNPRQHKHVNRKSYQKLALSILAPLLFFTFTIGWILYYVGQDKTKPVKDTSTKKDNIELMMIPPQELEITN